MALSELYKKRLKTLSGIISENIDINLPNVHIKETLNDRGYDVTMYSQDYEKKLGELSINFEDGNLIFGATDIPKFPKKRAAVINYIGIDKSLRSQGYGEKLLHKIIEVSLKQGCKIIVLTVAQHNHKAVKLYEKVGFKTFINKGNALFMKKDLK